MAIARLADPAIVSTAARVMAVEAQHACALRLLDRPDGIERAVPGAFVTGS
jgi:hypothetical protein